ncbi:MAG: ATP-binding protein [Ilumatobacteraceae bacterium]
MQRSSVIDLRPGPWVDRGEVVGMVGAIVAHLATVAGSPVDVFDALDAACHELANVEMGFAGVVAPDVHQPTWSFWGGDDHFGVVTTCAAGRRLEQFPLTAALGRVTSDGVVVTWEVGRSSTDHPSPPDPVQADGRRVRVSVPSAAEHAATVRAVVRSVFDFADDDEQARYLIATTEIFTNAGRATQRRAPRPRIEIDVVVDPGDGSGALTITDQSGGWNPDPTSPLDGESGLAIARAFVPGLTRTRGDGGCVVALPVPPHR